MFIDMNSTTGLLLNGLTTDVTGALWLTLLLILIFLVVICTIFRLPIEFSLLLTMPLTLVFMAYFSEFVPIGIIWLIFGGLILSRNIFIR